MASFDYDVVIVGSGFGGSVAALRAAEKGYRVGVMESGRRWKDEDIPKTQWDLPHFLWQPEAEMYGIQRMEYLDDVLILSGAGVGGGSHVYANTLYVPPKKFFDAPGWAGITDWADELAPCIDQATRMLGVVRYPYMPTDVDRHMQQVAIEMGRGEDVQQGAGGRLLRQPGRRGRGPVLRRSRAAPHRLHLVRQLQHRLRPQRQEQADDELPLPRGKARRRDPRAARGVRPRPARWRRIRGACASPRLGAASGASPPSHVYRRAGDRRRPRVRLVEAPASHAAQGPADRAIERARTNARGRTPNSFSRSRAPTEEWERDPEKVHITPGSVTITSGVWPDAVTSIEPTSGASAATCSHCSVTYHQHGEQKHPHVSWLKELVEHPTEVLGVSDPRHWSERSFVALCMQTTDTSIELYWHDGLLRSRHGSGTPPSVHIPVVEDFVDRRGQEAGQRRGGAADRGHQPQCLRTLRRRDPDRRQQRERGAVDPYLRASVSRAFTSWTGA